MPDRHFDGSRERWCVQLLLRAGIQTRIREIQARGELVAGTVSADDGDLVNRGDMRLIGWPERRPDEQAFADAKVDSHGAFRLLVPQPLFWAAQQEAVLLTVFYHGSARFAPCQSEDFPLR